MPHPDPTTSTARCWTLCSADGVVDVEVVAGDDEPLARVLPELARALGVPTPGLWSGSTRVAHDALLSSPHLRHGAVLGLGRPGPRTTAAERPSALELHVVGGPEAGRTEPLALGRHVVGRGAEATLALDDADVSRRHLQISVENGGIAVQDLGSTNGSRLDGVPLGPAPRTWPDGTVLHAGSSSLAVRGPDGWPASVEAAEGGRLRVRPSARRVAARPDVVVEFPRAPDAPPRRTLAWLAVALPAVAGIAMATWMHAPQFLFFALLSPVVAVGTWASDRWTGRRQGRRSAAAHRAAVREAEQRLADAVREDRRAAQARWPDLAALATVARRRTARLWERRRGDPDALEVRLGSGPGTGCVIRVAGDGTRLPEPVDDLPVVADLRGGGLAVVGPASRTPGVLSAVLVQLAVLHGPDELQVALVTRPDGIAHWSWLRWLPHLSRTDVGSAAGAAADGDLLRWLSAEIAARTAAATDGGTGGQGASGLPWLVVLLDRDVDARVAAALRSARGLGIVVLTAAGSTAELPAPVESVFELGGETGDRGVLREPDRPERRVVVDRVPPRAASDLARDLSALRPASASTALPVTVRLLDLPDGGLRVDGNGRVSGRWSRSRDALVATLGRSRNGPLRVDLRRQGPHALVAGTTGAGKSELLQSLIAGLALAHPPDRCSFLLVDYKGGAAFGEAVGLPHTVGLLTDLDGAATERALRSLGAELTRREHLLAAHAATDIAGLHESVALARLVIVVDEFATLAEEHPAFVPGLVGIAQRGRSLGVHLVLATQRPGGVVSPEIRANCSLRICLRTTDEADSRDVLGSGQAAFLPVDLPGRGFLRVGTAAPVELQVARVSASAPSAPAGPTARRWSWPATGPSHHADPAPGPSDLAVVAAALRRHAHDTGIPTPYRPWQAPLPVDLTAEHLDDVDTPTPPTRLRIGLVDRPDTQCQVPLELDLADGGGWLAVGGPRSGRTTLLRTVLAEAVARRDPDELHVHVLDHGGGGLAATARSVPHSGTAIGADDALRTVRLVDRLTQEVECRRAEPATSPRPALLLLVDGMEALGEQLDEADPAGGSAALLRLIRNGAAAGLTTVITADRATPGGRLAAVAGTRLLLPLPDRADYAVAGIPARLVPDLRPPGRALFGDSGLECQLALPRQLVPRPSTGRGSGALRIVELPADPELPPATAERRARPLVLPIGPGGDEGTLLSVDLRRTGGLLVVGPPGSGRSAALAAFAEDLMAAGVAVHAVSGSRDARSPALVAEELAAWLDRLAGRPGVVVVDDAAALADTTALTGIPTPGSAAAVAVVAAGAAGDLARLYQGPVAALRRSRTAVVLTPGPGDGELLGIRLPRAPVPSRPGSGWLVTGSDVQRVQVARRRGAGPPLGQSSSSAGPISCVAYQASS